MDNISRNEKILKSIINGEQYKGTPQSRLEELLLNLGDMIKAGGATPTDIQIAVNNYLSLHPVSVGMPGYELEAILQEVYGGLNNG